MFLSLGFNNLCLHFGMVFHVVQKQLGKLVFRKAEILHVWHFVSVAQQLIPTLYEGHPIKSRTFSIAQ